MAPGILEHPGITTVESRPSKRIKTSVATETQVDDEDVAAAIAVPSHPLGIKPAGNALTASENIKSRCGLFASLPDELLSHVLESFEADVLIRLGKYAETWVDRPFVLTTPVKQWPVYGSWTPEYLLERFPNTKFRAEAVDWPMNKYMSYMHDNADESPLYLFDRAFAEKTGIDITAAPHSKEAAYWSPTCFGDDLFSVLGEHRPDCRWMIMGPKRSGSTFHKDPNATSAWNAVLTGSKYWLMFPAGPGIEPPPGVIVSDDQSEITSPLSIAEYMLTFHELARQTPGCKEGICYAGEVLHVPSGWFHLVLNLEDSLRAHAELCATKEITRRPGLPARSEGRKRLQEQHPDLLEEGLAELEKKGKKSRGKWEQLTKGDEEEPVGGFSFGFGGDDDDADIP
ncbi:unnamed protein product [Alternaria alternata]